MSEIVPLNGLLNNTLWTLLKSFASKSKIFSLMVRKGLQVFKFWNDQFLPEMSLKRYNLKFGFNFTQWWFSLFLKSTLFQSTISVSVDSLPLREDFSREKSSKAYPWVRLLTGRNCQESILRKTDLGFQTHGTSKLPNWLPVLKVRLRTFYWRKTFQEKRLILFLLLESWILIVQRMQLV